ncbi:MAG: histidine phosphatase family protein [Solirubrobacterales bacterium]
MPPRDPAAALTLYLLRHAKSSWDDPSLADRDRPLAPRGLRAGRAIAAYVRERGIAPGLVLCSPSARTRETLELVGEGFAGERPPRVEFEAAIYGASADGLMEVLRRVPPAERSVMLVGHQPAIGALAQHLAIDGPASERLAGKFPTGALATFSVPGSWEGLGPACAELGDYVKPRELAAAD